MHLRHLEVIDALLRTGTVNAAAEWLGLGPLEVESRLAETERDNGVLWFSRSRGRLQPTPDLLALQPHIQYVLGGLEPLRRQVETLREHQAPPLRLMCSEPLVAHLLAQSVAALRKRFPDVTCQLASDALPAMEHALLLHECDLALALEPAEHPHIHSTTLAVGKVHFLAPHGWLGPRQRHIGLAALAGQGMLGLQQPDGLAIALEQRLRKVAPAPRVRIRVQSYQWLRAMVEAGEGLALVDPFTAQAARASGLDVCPVSPAIDVPVYALTRHGQAPQGAAMRALLEIVTEKAGSAGN
ncbi:LysR family transcriptional regulator [Pseudomonas typographi]|uniref:LysR family transcriptional regulator n=1 Tax=Pseudomonas typographi TaxID=2715964 RepID=UPI001687E1F8|nr:LysR family transcriptional regulator [Pseudomonas typographi]MBD1552018.1 LysR family transcriptional regulator [Pseudomonas typographi]